MRLDSGVAAGSVVSPYYDSMLAKLIAWGPDWVAAVERLTEGLAHFDVRGVATNIPLLLKIARNVTYRSGYTTTAFLTEHGNFLRPDPAGEPEEAFVLAAGAVLADPRSWRLMGLGVPVALRGKASTFSVSASREEGGAWRFEGSVNGTVRFERSGKQITAHVDGERCSGETAILDGRVEVYFDGARYVFAAGDPPRLDAGRRAHAGGDEDAIAAPMPGKVIAVAVKAGDEVAARDLLVVLEAMKMEHRIEAPRAGKVKDVKVEPGALVTGGATLVELH